ncbi:hypothetical protein CHS0354_018081 [Potamilus streckersoni]|uniref:Proteasome inhibitor PI31 subunit n=1 Tax=Potamilus streckersoni TaxID=2493646 RepID=A0AAE0WEC9_9BIVA|nr:hypothetical protein CHS0354_018081 [Potamilus streckersoni]
MASPGLELLFNSVKSKLHSPQDSIICALHWTLVANGLKCIGLSEESSSGCSPTEMLPDGWSDSQELYVFTYQSSKNGGIYIFKAITMDNNLLAHLWRSGDDCVENISINIDDYASEDLSSYSCALKKVDELCSRFEAEVIDQLKPVGNRGTGSPSKGKAKKSPAKEKDHSKSMEKNPLREPLRPRPIQSQPNWADPSHKFEIGLSDLDPLGHGGGGMFFDPLRSDRSRVNMDPSSGLPQRLPRGAVPPGARFDPFGPSGTTPGPDPDHEKPPGYDDMFM